MGTDELQPQAPRKCPQSTQDLSGKLPQYQHRSGGTASGNSGKYMEALLEQVHGGSTRWIWTRRAWGSFDYLRRTQNGTSQSQPDVKTSVFGS